MQKTYTSQSSEETKSIAKSIAESLRPKTTICLTGDLGAGKTTFSQGLLEALGAEPPFVSPTYVIMKQYDLATPSATGIARVYHTDAYRVEPDHLLTLGLLEWFEDDAGLIILEWADKLDQRIPTNRLEIVMKNVDENTRSIEVIFIEI